TLGDDPTASNGLSQVSSSNAGTPTVAFADPSATLTLNTGDGNDTVNLQPPDALAATPAAINVNTQGGNDTLALANGASLGTGGFHGGAGTDRVDHSAFTSAVAVNRGSNVATLPASLDADQEVPPHPTSSATGTATVTYHNVTHTLDITLTVTGISAANV